MRLKGWDEMRKTVLSLGMMAVTAAVCTGLLVWPITPRVPVETARVTRGNLVHVQMLSATAVQREQNTAVALTDGVIDGIFVRQGDWVKRGDVLLRLDDTAERGQMTALLKQKYALREQSSAALAALATQSEAMLDASIQQASAVLEMKTVRATADGQVRQVYLKSGAPVTAGSPVLLTADDGVELLAAERAATIGQLSIGMRALVSDGEKLLGTAEIVGFTAPQWDEALMTYTQAARLQYQGETEPVAGSRVQVRLCTQVRQNAPLVPLAAVSESGRIWVVKDGRAACRTLDCSVRDEENVLGDEELVGLSIVLDPDESRLQNGCGVKERKQ